MGTVSTQYQDELSRTDISHRFLKKKSLPTEPAPNDPVRLRQWTQIQEMLQRCDD